MPSRVWSHICNYATIDYYGRASIIEEFNTLIALELPIMVPQIYFISKWEGAEGEAYTLRIKMSNPEGKDFFVGPAQNFTVGQNYNYIGKIPNINFSVGAMQSVAFKMYGTYPLEFMINDVPIHIMTLDIKRP